MTARDKGLERLGILPRQAPPYVRLYGPYRHRLKNMMHYFVWKAPNGVGKTKLMLLLYFSDFGHFREYRSAISWDTYIKGPQGPLPKLGLELLYELHAERVLWQQKEQTRSGVLQHTQRAMRSPSTYKEWSLTSFEEDYLGRVWNRFRYADVADMVEESISEPPWRSVKLWEPLPYASACFGVYGRTESERE